MDVQRTLKVKLISASDLENVREMLKMKVYAEVSVHGKKNMKFYTPVDKVNETNPVWNYKVKFPIDEDLLDREGLMLVVKLYCKRTLGDRYIGEVCTSVKQLLHSAGPSKWTAFRYSLEKQGELILMYKFGHESVYDSSSEDEIKQKDSQSSVDDSKTSQNDSQSSMDESETSQKDSPNSVDDKETSFWESSFDRLAEGLKKIIESTGSDSSD